MNNEPVAWITEESPNKKGFFATYKKMEGNYLNIPLYIHPANVTYELTMEKCRQQQAELNSLRSVVYWLKENRPEVWDDIKKWSKM